MSVNWYWKKDRDGSVPLTWEQLRRLATSGEVSADSQVRKEGWNEWFPAQAVRGLFPEPFWVPGALDRKALKGSLLGALAGGIFGGVIGLAGGDLIATALGVVAYAVIGALFGAGAGFIVWLRTPREPSLSLSELADQAEPKPEPQSAWDKIGYVAAGMVLAGIIAAKALGPALRQMQNQPPPQQNQKVAPGNPQRTR